MSRFFRNGFNEISSFFNLSRNNVADIETKLNPQQLKEELTTISGCKKIFKKTKEAEDFDSSIYNKNIDDLIDTIVRAKEIDGYISRAVSNFKQKASKTGYKLVSRDSNNADKFEEYFENILIASGSSSELFFQQILNNFISFGNVFIHKTIDVTTGKIAKLTVLPSKGWTPMDSYGTEVIKWGFELGSAKAQYTSKNITYLTYDKETHHVLGTPITANSLQDAAILREIESENIQDYFDSLEKKTMFFVGDSKKPAKQVELDEVADKLNSAGPSEDLVLSGHVRVDVMQSKYNDKAMEVISNMKNRVLSALRTSSTSIGEKGAGRQDADTLDGQEDVVVEDIQSLLENQLNTKIIRELLLDLFGKVDFQNTVKIKFNETFTKKERREKHVIFKYLSGVITLDEVREELDEKGSISEDRLYNNLFNKSEEGTSKEGASNKTNPENQHGKKGNSKPSVKN